MDEIGEVKKAIRHENWKRMYEEYQSSGMTVKDWCKVQGIPVKTFYYRLKVLRKNLLKERLKRMRSFRSKRARIRCRSSVQLSPMI